MFYSKSTNGFYDREIHGDNIPSDVVEIISDEHVALLIGQSSGKSIIADENGYPVLADPPSLTPTQLIKQISTQRQAAYVAEADPLFFKAQRNEATMDDWLAKVQEIKLRYPK